MAGSTTACGSRSDSTASPKLLFREPRGIDVYALKWPGDSPTRPSYERVREDPSWTTHELDGAHNLMRDNPDDLLRILLDVAR